MFVCVRKARCVTHIIIVRTCT